MYQTMTVEIEGVSPLIMHNKRLADPLDEYTKAIAKISKKKNKTEAEFLEMSRLEFLGGLYLDDEGRPCIPGECIEGVMVAAAKKQKLGPKMKAGMISDGNWPVLFVGPDTVDLLWADGSFIDRRSVVIQRSRVMRTRTIFRAWKCLFELSWLPSELNKSQVEDSIEIAGNIGLLDYRPRYGRFIVSGNGKK